MLIPLLLLQTALAAPPVRPPDQSAPALLARARLARLQQDSALYAYQVVVRQRMSAGLGMSKLGALAPPGRERLAARYESVARVGWHRDRGAWAELLAARAVVPMLGDREPEPEQDGQVALVLPYYPGRDRLWPTSELRDTPLRDWFVHPLADSAEKHYAFHLGDSLAVRLPDGAVVRVRELRVRPRRPDPHLVVGSLWFDVASAQLVRAAYRPAAPVDLFQFVDPGMDDDDREMARRFGPYVGTVREVVIEHGLYEGRFWLPRARLASGDGTAKGMRMSVTVLQSFQYESVRPVPAGAPPALAARPDTRDTADARRSGDAWRDERRWGVARQPTRCRRTGEPGSEDASSRWAPDSILAGDGLGERYADGVRFRMLGPCDQSRLVQSPELPPSIYGSGEEVAGTVDFAELERDARQALDLGAQSEYAPQPIVWHYGLERGLLRYNRVEGLSAGVLAERELGKGYRGAALVRLGSADLQPNAEASLWRTNERTTLRASAYRRLAVVNDWGDPLGVGASLNALLFARDEGFYYRALGLELGGTHARLRGGGGVSWRLFAERHDSARVETQLSLAKATSGARFLPNVAASAGTFAGAAGALSFARGDDPGGTRVFGELRAEAAAGPESYGRAMLDATLAQGLGERSALAITGAAGSSAGTLPPQRLWLLGGAHTVRGQRAGTAAGDAFWLARAELGATRAMVRPAVFFDAGWAGPRADFATGGATLRGAGTGVSLLDGLVRLDVSRGLAPRERWRGDFYLDARF